MHDDPSREPLAPNQAGVQQSLLDDADLNLASPPPAVRPSTTSAANDPSPVAAAVWLYLLVMQDGDIALRAGGVPPEHLVGRKLARIAVAIYRARSLNRRPVGDLAQQSWVMPDDSLSHLASVRWLEAKQLDKRAVFRADSLLTLAQAARNGIGLAILPCYLADPDPMLVRVAAPIGELSSHVWLLTHPEIAKMTRIRTFMDFVYEAVKELRPLFEGSVAD